jgi:hypothetical protein
MNEGWNAISWTLIVTAQISVGYSLVSVINSIVIKQQVITITQFFLIPSSIWLGYHRIARFGVKELKPLAFGLLLFSAAILTAIPMALLIFNAVNVGVENQQQFQEIVIVRMVPYYTQLCLVFALLGFYITVWWHKAVPQTKKP